MALILKHQTPAQFVARLRRKWDSISKDDKARLATWLYNRYAAGDITALQIRAAFDLDTTAKWDAFRLKIQTLREHYLAIQGVV